MADLRYRLEHVGDIAVLCDSPGPGRRSATWAEVELFAEVERLRTVLNDLLLTRRGHEEATAAVMRLAFPTDGSEADEREHVEAWDQVAEAMLAVDAAWDRARSLLAELCPPGACAPKERPESIGHWFEPDAAWIWTCPHGRRYIGKTDSPWEPHEQREGEVR